MTDAAFLELLASYEAALEATKRSLVMARELADAQQDVGVPAGGPQTIIADRYEGKHRIEPDDPARAPIAVQLYLWCMR